MHDSIHDITIAASPEKVFDLLTTETGLRRWWTQNSKATPEVGHVNRFGFGDTVQMHFRVDRSERPRVLEWTCVDNPASPPEWAGTRIIAALEPTDAGTRLRFGHVGWADDAGALALCNTTWGSLMHRLRDAAEDRDRGPGFGASSLGIVRAYHDSWVAGRFDAAAELLSPMLDFEGPIDRFTTREPFIAALEQLGPIIKGVEIRSELERGDEVCLRYAFATVVPAIGTTEICEWFRVKDGVITEIRLYFDPRPYAAMFAAPAPGA